MDRAKKSFLSRHSDAFGKAFPNATPAVAEGVGQRLSDAYDRTIESRAAMKKAESAAYEREAALDGYVTRNISAMRSISSGDRYKVMRAILAALDAGRFQAISNMAPKAILSAMAG